MTIITSSANAQIKEWRKLQQRKYREATKTFFIEGIHLVEEAKKHHWNIEALIVEESFNDPLANLDCPIIRVNHTVFKTLSQIPSPQGIGAIVRMKESTLDFNGHLLLLDRIQDPGNLGTIIRTADAAGFEGIILGRGTVDLYNDKVIRATQGSLFHLPIIQSDLHDLIPTLKTHHYTLWASALADNASYFHQLPKPTKVALIMGNEGEGIHPSLIELADQAVKIPILGEAESLNVGIAAAVLMYNIAL